MSCRQVFLTLVAGMVLGLQPAPVLAQAAADASPKLRWRHYLTASTPELSTFSSQNFGYTASYGDRVSIGLHGGPAYRNPKSESFAPKIWGSTVGGSFQGAGALGDGMYIGGYLRLDRIRAGFDYQGFRQNPNSGVREAEPVQRARFEQTLFEVGSLFRFVTRNSPWAFQIEAGVASGIRGLYTPTEIYPNFDAFRGLFGDIQIPYNQDNRHIGIRCRLTVCLRIAGQNPGTYE